MHPYLITALFIGILSGCQGAAPPPSLPRASLSPSPSASPAPTPPTPDENSPSPETTEPAVQGADRLVLRLESWRPPSQPGRSEVAVYGDGRVFWGPDERGGYLEQRLTPEGLEQIRSRALSTGLFEHDLALEIDAVGSGIMMVRRGDLTVALAWAGTPEEGSTVGLDDRIVRASSAQTVEVTELEAYLRDPTTWGLPDEMYVQPEITSFVPSHLWVSYDLASPDWPSLPSPAREVATRILGPGFMDRCRNISLDQARELAQVLAQAGIIAPDYDVRFGLEFEVPGPPLSFVHAHPAIPHDVDTSCGDQ